MYTLSFRSSLESSFCCRNGSAAVERIGGEGLVRVNPEELIDLDGTMFYASKAGYALDGHFIVVPTSLIFSPYYPYIPT